MSRPCTESNILDQLRTVMDPELHKDVVTLNMVRDIVIDGSSVTMRVVLTTPACPLRERIQHDIEQALIGEIEGITAVRLTWDAEVTRMPGLPGRQEIPGVRNTIAVSAGKGGVGKSTVSVNLALALHATGARVGLLDADIYGPNIPIMLGIEDEKIMGTNDEMYPVVVNGISVISFGMVLKKGQPVIWRGPMLGKALREFLYNVVWGDLDYLIIDLPPGTGDVQLSLAQSAPLGGVVIVTTPQDVAIADVARGISMFQQLNVPVLGVIENMSTFVCPHCGEETSIFGSGGGEEISSTYGIPLLGSLPLDPKIRTGVPGVGPVLVADPVGPIAGAFRGVAEHLAGQVSTTNLSGLAAPKLPSGPRIPLRQ